jgi:predicted ATPase
VGKTRLSLIIGEQVLGDYPDGVWLVELAPILDPLLVPRTTAIAIGLRHEPQRHVIDMLSDYLHEKKILLILDNCEHLLDTCAQLADMLLKHCPRLKILTTSREALGILGEAVYHVPSLELPKIQQLVEKFRDYESVRLFEERAQLTRTDFSLTIENMSSVAEICHQLDGIPLAIELAAAPVGIFSAEQIAMRLQESFSLLITGNRAALPRQQTLQATIDWSYDLLSPAEQTLFQRLSVFVNGWTLEAAESICSDVNIRFDTISNLLTQLINKSLIVAQEEAGRTRYHMLETIRRYANKKLIEAGESEELRDRHLEYFLNLVVTAEPHLIRPEQLEWLPLLDADYENIRFAFEWSAYTKVAESSLNFCYVLCWFWIIRGYWLEGFTWVKSALAIPFQNDSRNVKVARVRAFYTNAILNWYLGNIEQMLGAAEASLELSLGVSNKRDNTIAMFLVEAALMLRGAENDDQSLSVLEQCFAEFHDLNEPFWQVRCFNNIGYLLILQAKLKFHELRVKGLELARKAGERLTIADALYLYSDWLSRINRTHEAKMYAEESEKLYKQIGAENNSPNFFVFAEIAWTDGDFLKAKTLYLGQQELLSILGERYGLSQCKAKLSLLAIEDGKLKQAQIYLEEALAISREIENSPLIALRLAELSNLFYLQGNLEAFREKFQESLSFKSCFDKLQKACVLMAILRALSFEEPEFSAYVLGVVHEYEKESDFPLTPSEKRYWSHAEGYARKVLGDAPFEALFAEGQKMSLDEALDLALKTVEEM